MNITDIGIERSFTTPGAWVMRVEVNSCRYTGEFADMGGLLMAISEMVKFFAVRAGKLRVKDAGFSRDVRPGRMGDEMILPGDKH